MKKQKQQREFPFGQIVIPENDTIGGYDKESGRMQLCVNEEVLRRLTTWPLLGSRRLTALLRTEGRSVNRKRVQRLMRKMGIAALGPGPRTTKPAPGHKIFPYLLRGITVEQPNQVWCADITYIPLGRGFLYLVAIMVSLIFGAP